MLTCHDSASCERFVIEVPDTFGHSRFEADLQHLVEVAVEESSLPIDRKCRPAHQLVHCGRIESLDEFLHVGFVLAGFQQVVQKTADRHVRDRIQPREDHVIPCPKFAVVGVLQLSLKWRQHWSDRIVDKGERQSTIGTAVTQVVQPANRVNRPPKDTFSALAIGVFFKIAGQRGHDFDAVLGEELGQIIVTGSQ